MTFLRSTDLPFARGRGLVWPGRSLEPPRCTSVIQVAHCPVGSASAVAPAQRVREGGGDRLARAGRAATGSSLRAAAGTLIVVVTFIRSYTAVGAVTAV